MKIKINKLICKKCNYEWVPRGTEVRLCPGCKTSYWDVERKQYKKLMKSERVKVSTERDKIKKEGKY